jgi:hypothetical protein
MSDSNANHPAVTKLKLSDFLSDSDAQVKYFVYGERLLGQHTYRINGHSGVAPTPS